MDEQIGIKHLIECRCILTQFKRVNPPVYHQFPVFSVVTEDSTQFTPKFVQCPNCGIIHKVVDVCKSIIVNGKEDMFSIVNIDDIKVGISDKIVGVLDQYDLDVATWENIVWIIDNGKWGEFVVLTSETVGDLKQGKLLKILGQNMIKVESFTREETL